MAQTLYDDRNNSIRDICKTLGISRATLYRYIKPRAPDDSAKSGESWTFGAIQ